MRLASRCSNCRALHLLIKVYDLTNYLAIHPGGDALLRFAGKDASKAIAEQPAHKSVPTFIKRLLEERLIGQLSDANQAN